MCPSENQAVLSGRLGRAKPVENPRRSRITSRKRAQPIPMPAATQDARPVCGREKKPANNPLCRPTHPRAPQPSLKQRTRKPPSASRFSKAQAHTPSAAKPPGSNATRRSRRARAGPARRTGIAVSENQSRAQPSGSNATRRSAARPRRPGPQGRNSRERKPIEGAALGEQRDPPLSGAPAQARPAGPE